MYDIFKGIIVIDLTKVLSGPLATRFLADYGAEVIKIESKEYPDPSRLFPPLVEGNSGYYEMLNRNKAAVALNLKVSRDLKKFYRLVETADVIVENMTPSAKKRLKIDYMTLKRINRKIIYASLSGIDQKTDRPYFDVIAQAESGMMSLTGIKEKTKIGPAIVDAFSGVNLAFGIASALYKREKDKKGRFVSVSMLASAMNLLEHNLSAASVDKTNPDLPGNHDNAIAPFGVFPTKDGEVVIAIGTEKIWQKFVDIFKEENLMSEKFSSNDNRLKNKENLTALINEIFSRYSCIELNHLLREHGIPTGNVSEMTDVLSDKWHYKHGSLIKSGKYIVPGYSVAFSDSKKTSLKKAPALGEDNKKYGI